MPQFMGVLITHKRQTERSHAAVYHQPVINPLLEDFDGWDSEIHLGMVLPADFYCTKNFVHTSKSKYQFINKVNREIR
jgi:hypothetical protein